MPGILKICLVVLTSPCGSAILHSYWVARSCYPAPLTFVYLFHDMCLSFISPIIIASLWSVPVTFIRILVYIYFLHVRNIASWYIDFFCIFVMFWWVRSAKFAKKRISSQWVHQQWYFTESSFRCLLLRPHRKFFKYFMSVFASVLDKSPTYTISRQIDDLTFFY